jgi:hypothetical protein
VEQALSGTYVLDLSAGVTGAYCSNLPPPGETSRRRGVTFATGA